MATNSKVLIVPAAPNAATNSRPASLRDIKPPVKIPDYWIFLWAALAIVTVAILVLWARRHLSRNRPIPPAPPPVPPHERARQKLEEALALIAEPKPFTILVSDTIRIYLEERFQFHAPERTTEEFLYELQATPRLTEEQKRTLGQFLEKCDLVKFARYEPLRPELMELHEAASRLIDETVPRPIETNALQTGGAK